MRQAVSAAPKSATSRATPWRLTRLSSIMNVLRTLDQKRVSRLDKDARQQRRQQQQMQQQMLDQQRAAEPLSPQMS